MGKKTRRGGVVLERVTGCQTRGEKNDNFTAKKGKGRRSENSAGEKEPKTKTKVKKKRAGKVRGGESGCEERTEAW